MKVGYSYLLQQFDVRPGKMKVSYMDLPMGTNATDILRALREQLKVCNFTLGPEMRLSLFPTASSLQQRPSQIQEPGPSLWTRGTTTISILT